MKIILEFSTEDFKANLSKTLEELFISSTEKKATKKTSKKAEAAFEEEEFGDVENESDEEESEDEESEVDADMIKEAVGKAVSAGNKAKVAALFTKYKAKTISNLKEAVYAKFYNELLPLTKKQK